MTRIFGIGVVALALSVAAANAQTTPGTSKSAPSDKKAISKTCSDLANAKGLHGKARKIFRSKCKHNGGKAS